MRDSGEFSDQIEEFLFLVSLRPVVRSAPVILGAACSPSVVVHGAAIIARAEVDPVAGGEANEPRNIVVALGEDHGAVGESLCQRSTISHRLAGNVLVAVLGVSSVAHL